MVLNVEQGVSSPSLRTAGAIGRIASNAADRRFVDERRRHVVWES
jgi:hypothetical protein